MLAQEFGASWKSDPADYADGEEFVEETRLATLGSKGCSRRASEILGLFGHPALRRNTTHESDKTYVVDPDGHSAGLFNGHAGGCVYWMQAQSIHLTI